MKQNLIFGFKIILIIFSIISSLRFLWSCINSFFDSPLNLNNFNYLNIIYSFSPFTHPFTFAFFIYLIIGLSFLILAISLYKNNKWGIIQGVVGFILYLYFYISISSIDTYRFHIFFLLIYIKYFFWISFNILSIIFLIYLYRKIN